MKTDFKPQRLDVKAFADAAAELVGEVALTDLPRLRESLHRPQADALPPLAHWQARGELQTIRGGTKQAHMHLQAHSSVPLECQRCLDTVDTPLEIDRHFVFVANEEAAAALDEDEDEADVLVLSRHFDLIELIEDELLLALPVVPRHDTCPQALTPGGALAPTADQATPTDERPNPFAVLAALKAAKDRGG